jgi:CRISPR-associated protein Cas7/Cst2/DevR subtype I-B
MITNNDNIPNITMTVIFEGSALNRNEKIGGNILSIKKIHVNGEERAFISKVALRHYLFQTLKIAFGWKEAQLAHGKEVIQFNVLEDNIFSSPELDAFGYMFTDEKTLTRKSPVGITKAISLHPYAQDLALYSNHDLVRRSRKQGNSTNPNLFTKEEFAGLFKFSITIDSEKIGKDFFVVENVDDSNNILTLELVKPETITFDDVDEEEIEGQKVFKYQDKNLHSDGKNICIPSSLLKKSKSKDKNEISIQTTPDVTFKEVVTNEVSGNINIKFRDIEKNKKNKIEKIILDDNQHLCFKSLSENNKVSLGTGKKRVEYSIEINESTKSISIPKTLFDENPDNSITIKKEVLKLNNFFKTELSDEEIETIENENSYCFILNEEPDYNPDTKKLKIKKGLSLRFDFDNRASSSPLKNYCENAFDYFTQDNNRIHIEKIKGKNKYQATLMLSSIFKSKRIRQLIEAIQDGLVSHTSGESNTLTPLFTIVGNTRIPSPVFHSFIDVKRTDEGGFEVIGIPDAINNGWLKENLFIKGSERLKAQLPKDLKNKTVADTFEAFLSSVNLGKDESESPAN